MPIFYVCWMLNFSNIYHISPILLHACLFEYTLPYFVFIVIFIQISVYSDDSLNIFSI
jgi:hypothetical protein